MHSYNPPLHKTGDDVPTTAEQVSNPPISLSKAGFRQSKSGNERMREVGKEEKEKGWRSFWRGGAQPHPCGWACAPLLGFPAELLWHHCAKITWWNVNSENTVVPFVRAGLPLLVMSWQVIRALSVPWKGLRFRAGGVQTPRTTNEVG